MRRRRLLLIVTALATMAPCCARNKAECRALCERLWSPEAVDQACVFSRTLNDPTALAECRAKSAAKKTDCLAACDQCHE